MAMVINTNVQSLNAQRNLNISQTDQKQAMDRLTSGKRINSAADDAAGLQIASGLTSQIRGLDQAVRNANDGISMVQTAEGALQESTNMLQRMRELSIQSANGIFTEGNREALNAEVSQLKEELTRIAETTTFNGLNILDGTLGSTDLQVGAQANETITMDFGEQSFAAEKLGGDAAGDIIGAETGGIIAALDNINAATAGSAGALSLVVNGTSVGDLSGNTTVDEMLTDMNSALESAGVEVGTLVETTASTVGSGSLDAAAGEKLVLAVKDAYGNTQTYNITDTSSLEELAEKITDVTNGDVKAEVNEDGKLIMSAVNVEEIQTTDAAGATGYAVANHTHNARLTLTDTNSADGEAITISVTASTAATGATENAQLSAMGINARANDADVTGGHITAFTAIDAGDITLNGVEIGSIAAGTDGTSSAANIRDAINDLSDEHGVVASISGSGTATSLVLNSVDGDEMSIELGTTATFAKTGLVETNISDSTGTSVADIDISTAAGAQEAIDTIDKALETINAARGEMGAVTNRLNYTVNNLASVSQAASASRSRIEDADFAAESANLSRAQVLQQAGTAMLAQANSAPQQVLSLLQ